MCMCVGMYVCMYAIAAHQLCLCIVDACIPTAVTIGFLGARLTVREGSTREAVVRVVKTGSTSETSSVAYTTEERTARAGADFVALSGMLVFTAEETEKEIAVSVLDDTLLEGQEYLVVILTLPLLNQTGLSLDGDRIRVDIDDDDGQYIIIVIIPHT